jgi:hypothetical protein
MSTTRTKGVTSSSGTSVSYSEEKIVCIPSKTSKKITEYSINKTLYRDCDLFRYPTTKQIKSKTFSKLESPLVFSNRITYFIGQPESSVKFENEFYVSEISNYPEKQITESRADEFCGEKESIKTKYFKDVSSDKFYISYAKGKKILKH